MARIIIVDDWNIEFVYKRTLEYLRNEGHSIKHAKGAGDAIKFLQEKRYDIAIIDLSEDNKVNGIETLSEAMERFYPSTTRVCWSAVYPSYMDPSTKEKFKYSLSKDDILEDILEILRKEGL